jgi:hypothetical protein
VKFRETKATAQKVQRTLIRITLGETQGKNKKVSSNPAGVEYKR